MNSVDTILDAVRPTGRRQTTPAFEFAYGDVISTSPTKIRIAGDTIDTQITERLASYTPTTNDRVLVFRIGPTWIIIGDLA